MQSPDLDNTHRGKCLAYNIGMLQANPCRKMAVSALTDNDDLCFFVTYCTDFGYEHYSSNTVKLTSGVWLRTVMWLATASMM